MAIIGTFTKQENGSYAGSLATLTIKAKINIFPVQKANDKAPDFRVSAANADIGGAWTTTSEEGKPYISVKLDDPSFPTPIHCRLVETADGYALIWGRRKPRD
jgi:uncharacterized protein (DUF736 family)